MAFIFEYPRIFKRDKLTDLRSSDGRISVAVMPFQNMSNDTKLNVWQDGIQNEVINNLTNSEGLNVRPSESINSMLQSVGITNYTTITPSVAGKISAKLNANVFISGSINQSGSIIRVNAQLTYSKTGDILKSFKKEGFLTAGSIFPIIDPLSEEIRNFLIISGLKDEVYIDPKQIGSTDSPEAYRYLTYGQKAFINGDFPEAINMLSQAVSIDSNLTIVNLYISWSYYYQEIYKEAKMWCLKAYEKRDLMSLQQKTYTNFVHAYIIGTPSEAIKYLKQLQEIDDRWPNLNYELGCAYAEIFEYDRAIPEFEKALGIFTKTDSKPWWPANYLTWGWLTIKPDSLKREKTIQESRKGFPGQSRKNQHRQYWRLLKEIQIKHLNICQVCIIRQRQHLVSCKEIYLTNLAYVYSEAGIPDKAEENYRKALSLLPDNPEFLNNLAWFLIDSDRNITEGLEIVEKALNLEPGNYSYLDCKGWGLYKLGKTKEALEFIEQSWEQKPIYDHKVYLHLEEVKKTGRNQK